MLKRIIHFRYDSLKTGLFFSFLLQNIFFKKNPTHVVIQLDFFSKPVFVAEKVRNRKN